MGESVGITTMVVTATFDTTATTTTFASNTAGTATACTVTITATADYRWTYMGCQLLSFKSCTWNTMTMNTKSITLSRDGRQHDNNNEGECQHLYSLFFGRNADLCFLSFNSRLRRDGIGLCDVLFFLDVDTKVFHDGWSKKKR